MKRPGRVVAALVAAGLLALAALPFVLPLEFYRGPTENAASRATGRMVAIQGPLRLTIFPTFGISAEKVAVANVPGARDANLVDIDTLIIAARLMPLLFGRLEVTDLVLKHPVIHLEIGRNGEPNWTTLEQASPRPARAQGSNAISNFTLGKMNIEDGRVTYFNAETGKSFAVEEVDLAIERGTDGGPLGLKGSLSYKGEKLNINASASNPGQFFEDEGSAAQGTVESAHFKARFDGNFHIGGHSTGALHIDGDSLRKLLAWIGYDIGQKKNFGAFVLTTNFDNQDKRIALKNLSTKLDAATLTGNLTLDRSTPTSKLSGEATIERFDLDSYLEEETKPDADAVKGTTPIDLAPLQSLNADVTLNLARFIVAEMNVDRAALRLKLNDGLLNADITSLSFYGGRGTANFAIDTREETPKYRHALHVSDVQMLPFLKDLAGMSIVDGKGTLNLDVSSRGKTGKAIWAGLAGKASLRLKNGTIRGVDLLAVSRLVQNLVTAEILSVAGDKAETKFTEMTGSFVLANGVARNKDFRVVSEVLTISGNGDIDLANRTLDVHLAPRATRRLPIPDVGLPFHIYGPWAKLRYGPEVKGLATSIMRGVVETPGDTISNPGKMLRSLLGLGK